MYIGTGDDEKKVNFRSLRAALRYAYRDLKDHPRSKPAGRNIYFEYNYGGWDFTGFTVWRIKKPNMPIEIICDVGYEVHYRLKSDGTLGSYYPFSIKTTRYIK